MVSVFAACPEHCRTCSVTDDIVTCNDGGCDIKYVLISATVDGQVVDGNCYGMYSKLLSSCVSLYSSPLILCFSFVKYNDLVTYILEIDSLLLRKCLRLLKVNVGYTENQKEMSG